MREEIIVFVEDLESANYYDALPRLSSDVYNYLKKIGVDKKEIADVGSGTGRITIDLLENGNTVYAIDPDSNMRQICDKKCEKYEGYIPIIGTDASMNIPDHSVDYVVSSQCYHRFNPKLFKAECNRVLRIKDNVIIIWYRVDFTKPIFREMLEAIKSDYKDYETRYDTDEIEGAKIEEEENNNDAKAFFDKPSHMEDVISKSYLSLEEFLNLGLSLALFPITHKMNTVSEVLRQPSFNKEKYLEDLKNIFNNYQKDGKIELDFRVQIHSK